MLVQSLASRLSQEVGRSLLVSHNRCFRAKENLLRPKMTRNRCDWHMQCKFDGYDGDVHCSNTNEPGTRLVKLTDTRASSEA